MPSTAKLLACLVLLLLATAASAKWVPPEFQPKATASVDATATKAAYVVPCPKSRHAPTAYLPDPDDCG